MERYASKSLDSPLPIRHLLRWHTLKCDNIIEGIPFKYKGNSTKIVHPYLTPTFCEMEQRYMNTFKPYTNKVKDTSIDALKAHLKGMTILNSSVEVGTKMKIWVAIIMFQVHHTLMIMLVKVDSKPHQALLMAMTYASVLPCSRKVYWILLILLEMRGCGESRRI
ncbi:hypothetical protein FXO37_08730 [Capsicum annuum]|nr:hypothetical protein FXO37_08730 [Capsicum annuum]